MNGRPENLIDATPDAIARAGTVIRSGGLVAFPTETVYGLGANATIDDAVAGIFDAKHRPRFNPLIVHVLDIAGADALAEVDDTARTLMDKFWPGPLTLILKRRAEGPVSLLATAGLDTVAVRSPDHAVARALLEAAQYPIAAPSANRSGHVSPTRAEHVARSLGASVDMILDGGPCRIGIESTVLDLSAITPVILRPGAVTREDIEALIGEVETEADDPDRVASPGQLASHYAPTLPVRMAVTEPAQREALLGFGKVEGATLNLSPKGDLREAAANLFAMLRELDGNGHVGIAVSPIPNEGLGVAINDRLARASAPRDGTRGGS